MDSAKSLGEKLTLLRDKKGWTKTYVANKLGIKTVSTYANWEYNTRQPDNEMIVKIAELYDVTTDYLLGRTDIPDYNHNEQQAFEKFKNDPDLQRFFYELPESEEEDLQALKEIWEIIKSKKK